MAVITTMDHPVHGTKKDNAANLHLEDGETVIQVKANRCKSSSASTDVVKHLSFTTQKKTVPLPHTTLLQMVY